MPTTRNNASRSRKPAGRASSKRQDERHELLPSALVVVAILMLLASFISSSEYSSLYSVRHFLTGIVGSMTWTLPIAFGCAGFLAFRVNNDRAQLKRLLLLVAVFEFSLLSAVEAFSCETIAARMQLKGYFNFLSFAYRHHAGGGMFGALIGWPLTSLLTPWGAMFACILFMVLCLIGMQLVSVRRITEKVSRSIQSYRESHPPREKVPAPKRMEPAPARRTRPDAEEQELLRGGVRLPNKASARPKPAGDVRLPAKNPSRPAAARGTGRLYEEQIAANGENPSSPVKLPNFANTASARRRVTPVTAPEGGLTIPEVDPKTAYRLDDILPKKKPARSEPAPKAEESRLKIEQIDLMEAVRSEDPEKRNRDYMKNALGNHARRPKPVLTYSIDTEDETPEPKPAVVLPNRPKSEPATPVRRASEVPSAPVREAPVRKEPEIPKESEPRAEVPERRVPAEPKPSFFEEAPVVKKPDPYSPEAFENPNTVVIKPTSAPKTEKAPEPVESAPYDFPPIDLMEAGSVIKTDGSYDAVDIQRSETLVKTLQSFSIPVKITGISHGPAVTRFELLPAPGIKVSRIASYADDIAMNLAAISVRIEAPIPGKSAVGVEVPNVKTEVVHLRDVLESQEARKAASRLAVGLGKDNSGKYIVADLASMPHVLIAGQTGSGKSVCINAIIISILFRATPDEVKLILIDPKMVELNVYNGIPHLMVPVVTDPKKAASSLDWAVAEMTRRYKVFAERGAKNIQSYNRKLEDGEKPMPQIVLIVDELADLMMTAPRDVEEAINRLAQLARAAGIHMVIATQRPSVDIITGVIKANIPTRIAFTVASGVDSRTILDSYGAEKLLGRGDMLYLPSDRNKPMRIQGAWVSEAETQAIVDYITSTQTAEYDEEILEHMEKAAMSDADKNDKNKEEEENTVDELFQDAVKAVVDAGQASISMLQRKLRVGYARAGRLIDEMASRGLVSQSEGSKSREVLVTREQYRQLFEDNSDSAGSID